MLHVTRYKSFSHLVLDFELYACDSQREMVTTMILSFRIIVPELRAAVFRSESPGYRRRYIQTEEPKIWSTAKPRDVCCSPMHELQQQSGARMYVP